MQAMSQAPHAVTAPLDGVLASLLLLGAALALPASFVLIKRYLDAVKNSMQTGAGSPPAQPTQRIILSRPRRPARAESDIIDGAGALHAEALRAPWRAAAVYAVAGLCHAFVMAAAYDLASETGGDSSGTLVSTLFLLSIFAWPVVLTVNLVAATTPRAKLTVTAVYFLFLAAVCVAAGAYGAGLSWGHIIVLWLVYNVPPTLLLLTFLNRRVRAVGPLVLIFMLVAVIGTQLAFSALFVMSDEARRSLAGAGSLISVGGKGVFWGFALAGFLLASPVGWLAMRWVRGRYERKKDSDQSITLDAVWLLFGVTNSVLLVPKGGKWVLSGFVAFLVYKVVSRVGLSLAGRRGDDTDSPTLLLLRVFSLGERSVRLFGALSTHWRHVGAIRLIAGPDLATTTVEPHEFLDYLSGKLSHQFIDGAETLDQRIDEMDTKPDQDGRYRVNDFFCRSDTWRMVLSRLVRESDAVLMDLRGFNEKNDGCVHEIRELFNVMPLQRVCFVVDETTDRPFLEHSLRDAQSRMKPTSPNRAPGPAQPRLFRFTGAGAGDLRQLLLSVCVAAKSA